MGRPKAGHILVIDPIISEAWEDMRRRYIILQAKTMGDAARLFAQHKPTLVAIVLSGEYRQSEKEPLAGFLQACRKEDFQRPVVTPTDRNDGPNALRGVLHDNVLREIHQAVVDLGQRTFLERFVLVFGRSNGCLLPPPRLASVSNA